MMLDDSYIKEIELELRRLRNQFANCESQNRILLAYVADNERRKEARQQSAKGKATRAIASKGS